MYAPSVRMLFISVLRNIYYMNEILGKTRTCISTTNICNLHISQGAHIGQSYPLCAQRCNKGTPASHNSLAHQINLPTFSASHSHAGKLTQN